MILKNKKGLTLVELLICIVMMSGLSILMYNLLSDISTKRKSAETLGNMVIKGSEATAALEQMIYNVNISEITISQEKVEFYVQESIIATIEYTSDEVKVYNYDESISKKWTFSNTDISLCSTITTSSANAIDIYLILKQNDKVIGTIEFPYYNKTAFTITKNNEYELIRCGE